MKRTVRVEPRKTPKQSRSIQMVEDILTAAIRVLQKHSAAHFTTILVAKEAGISVGSLYQYFPDKGAILFAVQMREWEETQAALEAIIFRSGSEPYAVLETLMMYFFESEWKERALRQTLKIAIAEYKSVRQFAVMEAKARSDFHAYIKTSFSLPHGSTGFWADFLLTSMFAFAEETTSRVASEEELKVWSGHYVRMIIGYFQSVLV
jgi:AcrR family transcriptional regulator